ncbi:MAG: capsid cement protein, partial [Rickettsia sp.]
STLLDGVNQWAVGDTLYFANSVWNKVAAKGRLIDTSIKTANYTAVTGERVRCNTTGGAFTITLPTSPNDSDYIGIMDTHGTFGVTNLTVARGNAGHKIQGSLSNLTCDVNGAYIELVFVSATSDWRIMATPAAAIPVTSVFARTGDITASSGDYTATQVTNTPAGNIAAVTVQAALNELDTEKVPYTGASGNVDLGANNLSLNALQLSLTPTIVNSNGLLYYDQSDRTLAIDLDTANGVTLQVGQENHIRAVNNTGSAITNGQIVYINGVQGNRPTIALAQANAISTSQIIGVATQDIADNNSGYVTTMGIVRGINTTGFSGGDVLYLSPSTPGLLTNVVPSTPNNVVIVGRALNSTVSGSIF